MAAALLGLVIGGVYMSPATMTLEAHPRLNDSEYALLQTEVERFAERLGCSDLAIELRSHSPSFFELSIRNKPVLLVDNAGSQLLAVTMSAGEGVEIDLHRWNQQLSTPGRGNENLRLPEHRCPPSDPP
ncbi:hypothetical protein [Stenotrophomonas forensis]|uniref:hypothetical protein n=1 Tax=Stenotrophomonas forensis TaxID=2871169 RepID=UPI0039C716B7